MDIKNLSLLSQAFLFSQGREMKGRRHQILSAWFCGAEHDGMCQTSNTRYGLMDWKEVLQTRSYSYEVIHTVNWSIGIWISVSMGMLFSVSTRGQHGGCCIRKQRCRLDKDCGAGTLFTPVPWWFNNVIYIRHIFSAFSKQELFVSSVLI